MTVRLHSPSKSCELIFRCRLAPCDVFNVLQIEHIFPLFGILFKIIILQIRNKSLLCHVGLFGILFDRKKKKKEKSKQQHSNHNERQALAVVFKEK